MNEDCYKIVDGCVTDVETGKVMPAIYVKAGSYTSKDGNTYNSYKAVKADTRFIDLSFTRNCENAPADLKVPANYIFVFDNWDDLIIDKNRLYPRVYVKSIVGILPYNKTFKDTFTC